MGVVVYTVREGTLNGEVVGTYRHPGTYEPAIDDLIVVEQRRWRVTDHLSVEPSQDPNYNTLIVELVDAEPESD
jgi:hypothetical protein